MLDNPNPSIDELYRQSRILQHRTRRESKRTHYLDLARLFRKILDVTGSIRSSQLGYLSSFDQEETFRALSVRERFDVLRNFGLIFTKTAQAQAPLEDGVSSYADIGQYLLERALRIAELDVEAGESSVPAEDIANAFREKFESETNAGKITEVIDTLNLALAPVFDFNERTRRSFLIDYVVALEKISAYGPANGGNDPTDEAWINRVVNDPALADEWIQFQCMLEVDEPLSSIASSSFYLLKAADRADGIAAAASIDCGALGAFAQNSTDSRHAR